MVAQLVLFTSYVGFNPGWVWQRLENDYSFTWHMAFKNDESHGVLRTEFETSKTDAPSALRKLKKNLPIRSSEETSKPMVHVGAG